MACTAKSVGTLVLLTATSYAGFRQLNGTYPWCRAPGSDLSCPGSG